MYFFTFPTLQYLFAETLKCFKTSLIASIFSAVGYLLGSFNSSTALGHRKAANQNPFHLCDMCNIYFEAILCFYVLFIHLVGNSLFQLIRLSLDCNIKRYFAFTLVKLFFYVDYAVRFLQKGIATVFTCINLAISLFSFVALCSLVSINIQLHEWILIVQQTAVQLLQCLFDFFKKQKVEVLNHLHNPRTASIALLQSTSAA